MARRRYSDLEIDIERRQIAARAEEREKHREAVERSRQSMRSTLRASVVAEEKANRARMAPVHAAEEERQLEANRAKGKLVSDRIAAGEKVTAPPGVLLPTVLVRHRGINATSRINAHDFDPERHELLEPADGGEENDR